MIVRIKPRKYFEETFSPHKENVHNFTWQITSANGWPSSWDVLYDEVIELHDMTITECRFKTLIGGSDLLSCCYDVMPKEKYPEYYL